MTLGAIRTADGARRSIACAALAALLLQFLLAFGHTHLHEIGAVHHGMIAATAAQLDPATSPSVPGDLSDDEDHCSICFSSFLLSTTFLPDDANQALAHDIVPTETPSVFNRPATFKQPRSPFLSRAPPTVG
ncbi:DUF2946 family protein [Rhodopseudomonas sp. B29]|uniref:DUF2946 family protein n=1 Tax=Rhodopseudomonas sp. B29 TaxID=95607 RepID=UPI00034A4C53|nr:DUF2946 family protein [Rhodopseudomonas sp. B29]